MAALDRAALIEREPALADMSDRLADGLFSPTDSVGDCRLFTKNVADVLASEHGVKFLFGTRVTGLEVKAGAITRMNTNCGAVQADAVLLATGTQTQQLTQPLGFVPIIYLVKGYSGTWAIRDPSRIPRLPFGDETELLAVASYGGHLRVTAIAEFAGRQDISLPEARLEVLRDYVPDCLVTPSIRKVRNSGPASA